MKKILIIKLGALGDFVMAQPAFAAIRKHHADNHVTLLTIPSLAKLARDSGLFNDVITDPRESWPLGHWRIARRLARARYGFIYDLQGTGRTAWYWRMMWPRAEWAGPVRGCSHRRPPRPPHAHRIDWYRAQLTALGLAMAETPHLDWLNSDLSVFQLPARYALLIAGGSAHRPEKRWPAAHYAQIARHLIANRVTPLLIGTGDDVEPNRYIVGQVPGVTDLTGQTSIAQLASLARGAVVALGNDTGPMHVIAAARAPCVVLFSNASDPEFIRPRGPAVRCLQQSHLADLAPTTVIATLTDTMKQCA